MIFLHEPVSRMLPQTRRQPGPFPWPHPSYSRLWYSPPPKATNAPTIQPRRFRTRFHGDVGSKGWAEDWGGKSKRHVHLWVPLSLCYLSSRFCVVSFALCAIDRREPWAGAVHVFVTGSLSGQEGVSAWNGRPEVRVDPFIVLLLISCSQIEKTPFSRITCL